MGVACGPLRGHSVVGSRSRHHGYHSLGKEEGEEAEATRHEAGEPEEGGELEADERRDVRVEGSKDRRVLELEVGREAGDALLRRHEDLQVDTEALHLIFVFPKSFDHALTTHLEASRQPQPKAPHLLGVLPP